MVLQELDGVADGVNTAGVEVSASGDDNGAGFEAAEIIAPEVIVLFEENLTFIICGADFSSQ